MPIHLYNLLLRAAAAIPTSLGSTWLGLFFPLLVFALTQLAILWSDGVAVMRSHWKLNVVRGFAVAGAAWAALFLWCVVTTTYDDHMALAKRTGELRRALNEANQHEAYAVQSVRATLGSQLSDLKEQCARFEGSNTALERQTVAQQNTINNCQTQALKLLAPEPFEMFPLALSNEQGSGGIWTFKILVLVNKPVTPINLTVDCSELLISMNASIVGGGVFVGNAQLIGPKSALITVSSPAMGPHAPLLLTALYAGDASMTCHYQLNR